MVRLFVTFGSINHFRAIVPLHYSSQQQFDEATRVLEFLLGLAMRHTKSFLSFGGLFHELCDGVYVLDRLIEVLDEEQASSHIGRVISIERIKNEELPMMLLYQTMKI